jgi:hypothetical protein
MDYEKNTLDENSTKDKNKHTNRNTVNMTMKQKHYIFVKENKKLIQDNDTFRDTAPSPRKVDRFALVRIQSKRTERK